MNAADHAVLVAHQPAYLPWPGYFTRLIDPRVQRLVLLDHVQFSQRGWQNRNTVADRRGRPTLLTVPVRHRHGQSILATRIAGTEWARRHWRTLGQHYGNARYWPQFSDRLCAIYHTPWASLTDLNTALTALLLDGFGVDLPMLRSSTLGLTQSKTQLLVELCAKTGTSVVRVGTGALDYLDAAVLRAAGIAVEVATYRPPQALVARGTVSAVDTLLHHGPQARELICAGARTNVWDRCKAVAK